MWFLLPLFPPHLLDEPWAERAISHLPCALVRRGRADTVVKLLQLTPCACPSLHLPVPVAGVTSQQGLPGL